jgi:hypothetical protein
MEYEWDLGIWVRRPSLDLSGGLLSCFVLRLYATRHLLCICCRVDLQLLANRQLVSEKTHARERHSSRGRFELFSGVPTLPGGAHIKAATEVETETDPETGIVTKSLDIVVGIRGRAERIFCIA